MRSLACVAAAAMIVTTACSTPVERTVVLDITNDRDEPIVVRMVPDIVPGPPVANRRDTGTGAGFEIQPGEGQTLELRTSSDDWSVTVNGAPALRSSDRGARDSVRVRARLVVHRESQILEVLEFELQPVESQ